MPDRNTGGRRALVLMRDGRRYEATVMLDGAWVHMTAIRERFGCRGDLWRQRREDRTVRSSLVSEIRWVVPS